MGLPMAKRLLAQDYPVSAYNRTQEKSESLKTSGARIAQSPPEAIRDADCVVLMLADMPAIREVLLGEETRSHLSGRTVIQMGTIGPSESRQVEPPPKVAASGVMPRVEVPGIMRAVRIKPQSSELPFYAKLRAEVDRNFFGSGEGTLYLGFHVDPIYRVHWNNLVNPLKFEIKAPEGITVFPSQGEGPQVAVPSDIDPREFLLDVKQQKEASQPLELAVRYFACNDEEGWCIPVSQKYSIYLESDSDLGQNLRRSWSWSSPEVPPRPQIR